MINRIKIIVKEKAKALFNIFICLVFMKIGIYLTTLKSNLKLLELPLYPVIGFLVIVVNGLLLLKWISRFHKATNL